MAKYVVWHRSDDPGAVPEVVGRYRSLEAAIRAAREEVETEAGVVDIGCPVGEDPNRVLAAFAGADEPSGAAWVEEVSIPF